MPPQTGCPWTATAFDHGANVTAQRHPAACGYACGEMVLRSRGAEVSQSKLEQLADSPGLGVGESLLASALNLADPTVGAGNGTWRGGYFKIKGKDAAAACRWHCEATPWIAMLWWPNCRIGHWVVVEELCPDDSLWVADPYGTGSRYCVKMPEFLSYWNETAVRWN